MSTKWVGLLLVAGILAAGCDKQTKPEEVGDISKIFSQVDVCMSNGDTNGALTVLSEAMKDKLYARDRSWIYSYILNIYLMGDRAEEAKTAYLAVIGKDEELTRIGFGMMYGYYQQKGDNAVLEAWVKQMVESPLPKDLLAQAYSWQMGIFRAKGQFDQVLQLVPVCMKKFDAGTNSRIFGEIASAEMAAAQYDNASKLLDAVEKVAGSNPELKDLVAVDRGEILFMRERWQDAEQHFVKVASGLQDGSLAGWFSRVSGRCIGKQQLDLADRLCDFLLKNQKDKASARREAAMQWIEVAKARKDIAAIPVRLEALLSLYRNEFYTVLGDGKKPTVVATIAFGDKLEKLLPREDDKAQVRTMALDGSFITEDYARSLKILEGGIPERDKAWHEMAINKAKAHLALQAGKHKEAIDYFRKFMTSVATWEKPEQDPITGILYTKEMCLGRNAKRIGDIWTKAGDAKAAADAYTEAKGYYEKALLDVKADSKEAEVINTEMAEIGKPPEEKKP
jgi:tetratricopeptide (TPR) repeat protein